MSEDKVLLPTKSRISLSHSSIKSPNQRCRSSRRLKMGKRKISMQRISDQRKRLVTFSKRRKGLFKKAEELCSLTGATIAIVCFSEVGNPFTFCYPPPPTEGQDRDGSHQRVLSIMQQYSNSSSGCTITIDHSQPAPMVEPKSIGEYQNIATGLQQSGPNKDKMWVSLQPLYDHGIDAFDPSNYGFGSASSCIGVNEQEMRQLGQLQSMEKVEAALMDSVLGLPVEEGLVESSSCGSSDYVSANNCCYSWFSPPPSPSIEALLSSPSSSFSNLDFLGLDTEEGAITPSPFFFF